MSTAPAFVINFINAAFTALFLVHIFLIGYFIINPEVPETIIYKKNIKEIKFPIIFKICLFDIGDQNLRDATKKRAKIVDVVSNCLEPDLYNLRLVLVFYPQTISKYSGPSSRLLAYFFSLIQPISTLAETIVNWGKLNHRRNEIVCFVCLLKFLIY